MSFIVKYSNGANLRKPLNQSDFTPKINDISFEEKEGLIFLIDAMQKFIFSCNYANLFDIK